MRLSVPITILTTSLYLFAGNTDTAGFSSLLWEVIDPVSGKKSYLLGTMHVLCGEASVSKQFITEVIKPADAVVLEIDLGEIKLGGLANPELARRMRLPDTIALKDLFSTEEWNYIDSVMRATTEIELTKFNSLKPMAVSTFWLNMLVKDACGKKVTGVEKLVYKAALKKKKPIIGLETATEQISILMDSISLRDQSKLLLDFAKEASKVGQKIMEADSLYSTGDVRGLIRALQGEASEVWLEVDSLRKLLVDNRNKRWVKKLKPLLKENSLLIAVGALHLVGENGLVNLLRQEGFQVYPVSMEVITRP